MYGMTESLNIACTLIDFNPDEYKGKKVLCVENEGMEVVFSDHISDISIPKGEMCVSSGKLLPSVEAKIVDVNSGECLGPHKAGHIHVRSPNLMKGYVSLNPESVLAPMLEYRLPNLVLPQLAWNFNFRETIRPAHYFAIEVVKCVV